MKRSNILITLLGLALVIAVSVRYFMASDITNRTQNEVIATIILVVAGIVLMTVFTVKSVRRKIKTASAFRKIYDNAYLCQIEHNTRDLFILTVDEDTVKLFESNKKASQLLSIKRGDVGAEITKISLNSIRSGHGLQLTLTGPDDAANEHLLQSGGRLRLIILDDNTLTTPAFNETKLEPVLAALSK